MLALSLLIATEQQQVSIFALALRAFSGFLPVELLFELASETGAHQSRGRHERYCCLHLGPLHPNYPLDSSPISVFELFREQRCARPRTPHSCKLLKHLQPLIGSQLESLECFMTAHLTNQSFPNRLLRQPLPPRAWVILVLHFVDQFLHQFLLCLVCARHLARWVALGDVLLEPTTSSARTQVSTRPPGRHGTEPPLVPPPDPVNSSRDVFKTEHHPVAVNRP